MGEYYGNQPFHVDMIWDKGWGDSISRHLLVPYFGMNIQLRSFLVQGTNDPFPNLIRDGTVVTVIPVE